MEVSEQLTQEKFFAIVRGSDKLSISDKTSRNILHKREQLLSAIREGKVMYGVNTGVGSLKDLALSPDVLKQFQLNLIRSHAESVGPNVARDVVKGSMVLLAHSLSQGYSGISPELLERIVFTINEDLVPDVGCFGSVGASGDLSFLASLMLGILGEKPVVDKNGNRVLLERFTLTEKEGLAVINGTHFSLSHFIHLFSEFKKLEIITRWIYVLHLESRRAIVSFLDPLVSKVKPDPYMAQLTEWLRSALESSQNVRISGPEVQEPYVVRCFPQIYSPVLRTCAYIDQWLDSELNAVSDNPLFDGEEPIFQGNFHAENIAMMSTQIRTLIPLMANTLYQLQEKLLNPEFNRGLPAFLAESPGLDSGLMIVQYLSADLLSEICSLAIPITVVNQTMSGGQEDIVSFAPTSNRLLERQLMLYRYLVSATMLIVVRAVQLRGIEPSQGVRQALGEFLKCDVRGERSFSDIIEHFSSSI